MAITRCVLWGCSPAAAWARHAGCAGWQLRFGERPPDEVLVCSCVCGHKGAVYLLDSGTLRPPPGMDADGFRRLLTG